MTTAENPTDKQLPPEALRPGASGTRMVFLVSAALALVLDQATKLLVQAYLMDGGTVMGRSVRVLGEVLYLTPARNPAGIFGISFGSRLVHILLAIAVVAVVIVLGLRARERWTALTYGIILGGAIGNNLVDRIRFGWVLDFIDFRLPWMSFRWYTFNLADTFLVVGVLLLLARDVFGLGRRPPSSPKS